MDEILFRGKSSDTNKWAYGYLIRDDGDSYITNQPSIISGEWLSNGESTFDENFGGLIKVIPETVGQYLEIQDKNRKKLYDGDFIRYDNNEEMSKWVSGSVALIVFEPSRFLFRMEPFNISTGSNQNIIKKNDCEDVIEYIGNRYDNPELLGDLE